MKGDGGNDLSIVDAHVHLGYNASFYMPDISLERMISLMDRFNIKRVCCSHLAGLEMHHFELAHRETRKAIERYPGRIFGYAIYDPNFAEESLMSIKKYYSTGGFVGVKIHPAMHTYPLDGEKYDCLWEFAVAKDVPVLTHTWDATPQTTYPYELVPNQVNAEPKLINRVAQRYPELRIILAHAGGHYRGHLQAIKVAKRYENIYIDICGATFSFGLIEWFVKEVGAHKILYGSDMNWIDLRVHLGRVLGAKISLHEKEHILSINANNLFGFGS